MNTSKPGTIEISNYQKLMFYALYKTSMIGKVTGKRPGMTQIVARYKWDAWKKASDEGLTKE